MKRIILAALLMIAPVQAEEYQFNLHEHCAGIGKISESIMRARQNNVPMSSLMAVFEGDEEAKLFQAIIGMAFDFPVMRSPHNKEIQAQEFRNRIEVMCYRREN